MKKILIFDFGNPSNEDLKDFIENQNLEVEILPRNTQADEVRQDQDVIGIILSGECFTEYEDDIQVFDGQVLELDMPILGLGRGMQVFIHELGGTVTPQDSKYQATPANLKRHNVEDGIFKGLEEDFVGSIGFDAAVSDLPDGFKVLANGKEASSGDDRPFGAIENPEKDIYGVQYVMDINNVKSDQKTILNFLEICINY